MKAITLLIKTRSEYHSLEGHCVCVCVLAVSNIWTHSCLTFSVSDDTWENNFRIDCWLVGKWRTDRIGCSSILYSIAFCGTVPYQCHRQSIGNENATDHKTILRSWV